jgi:hypothetical protein
METPNPLAIEQNAIKPQYRINPFRTKKSYRWKVAEMKAG